MLQLLRFVYPAAMLVGLNGLGVVLVNAGAPPLTLLGLLASAIAFSFIVERIIPYEPSWNSGRGDVLRDWLHFAVNETLNVLSVAALPVFAALTPWSGSWPVHLPLVLQLALAIIIFDLGATLTHWASHKLPFLWRFHAVHHSVKRFYGFNGLMKHPIHQALEMTIGVLPLVALGLPTSVASLLALAAGIQLLMQHSNVDYAAGPLRFVLALNASHRFHHIKWAGEGDVNFGFFTNIWDHILGTWSFDPARRFTSDDIGIGKEPDFPTGYVAQLAAPFHDRGQS